MGIKEIRKKIWKYPTLVLLVFGLIFYMLGYFIGIPDGGKIMCRDNNGDYKRNSDGKAVCLVPDNLDYCIWGGTGEYAEKQFKLNFTVPNGS